MTRAGAVIALIIIVLPLLYAMHRRLGDFWPAVIMLGTAFVAALFVVMGSLFGFANAAAGHPVQTARAIVEVASGIVLRFLVRRWPHQ